MRRVTISLIVRHYPLTVARVNRVALSQEHIHSCCRDLVTVSVTGEWPFYRVTTRKTKNGKPYNMLQYFKVFPDFYLFLTVI